MKSIHQRLRFVFPLLLVIALSPAQLISAATKRTIKNQKRGVPEKARSSAKPNRSERGRLAQRRRAEASRLAAIARQRAMEATLRDRVQVMIAKDDVAGEDPEIRRIAVNALGNHAGAVVVMDPQTGRVYSIVNNRGAGREGSNPCSTIKLVTGLAGLNESVIDPSNTMAISDSNRVNLTQALAYSKNDYFQQVGGQVGFAKMVSYARQVGLGSKTDINLRNESAGRLPSLRSGFGVNHMSSHGDGFKVTALQLARLVSVFANRGSLIVPFVPHPGTQDQSRSHIRREVNIDAATWQSMTPGMVGAVRYGSGRKAYDPLATIAGKTGTCIEDGTWVGLFTSFAPLNDPKLAIVVIARGSDGRNHFPAAVAGRIYRELNRQISKPGDSEIASGPSPVTIKSNPKVVEPDQAGDDDEESADAGDEDVNTSDVQSSTGKTNKTIWGTERISPDRKVKNVIMS